MQIQHCSEIGQTWDARKWYVCLHCCKWNHILKSISAALLRTNNGYGLSRCELVFENCFVPEENVLGKEGKGFASLKFFPFSSGYRKKILTDSRYFNAVTNYIYLNKNGRGGLLTKYSLTMPLQWEVVAFLHLLQLWENLTFSCKIF